MTTDPLDAEGTNGSNGRGRAKQIWECLSFGLRPWWMYERTCHYQGWSYWRHLAVNLRLAWRLTVHGGHP